MDRLIVAVVAVTLFTAPAFAIGCTGIGKGSPPIHASARHHPCKPGEVYNARMGRCVMPHDKHH
jgi:hypothetical protein